MLCSNCGSPRTRYVKTLNNSSARFTNERLLQEKIESVDIYKCMTCGSSFDVKLG